jgi:hypothetical protein
MAVYNRDEEMQDGNGAEIEAAVMVVDVDSGQVSIVQMQRLTLLALVSLFRRFASCRRSVLGSVVGTLINAHPSSFLGATKIPITRLVSSNTDKTGKFLHWQYFFPISVIPRITFRLAGQCLGRKTCSHRAQIENDSV